MVTQLQSDVRAYLRGAEVKKDISELMRLLTNMDSVLKKQNILQRRLVHYTSSLEFIL